MTAPGIALVCESRLVSGTIATVLQDVGKVYCEQRVCPAYNRLPVSVELFTSRAAVAKDMPLIIIGDEAPEPDELGHHTEEDGAYTGLVAVHPILGAGGDFLTGPISVSATFAHELAELLLDPDVNLWARAGDDSLWAREVCDAVEDQTFELMGVTVSNFVHPPFWNPQARSGARFDEIGSLSAPFTMSPGGYSVVQTTDGTIEEVGAAALSWRTRARSQIRRGAERRRRR